MILGQSDLPERDTFPQNLSFCHVLSSVHPKFDVRERDILCAHYTPDLAFLAKITPEIMCVIHDYVLYMPKYGILYLEHAMISQIVCHRLNIDMY